MGESSDGEYLVCENCITDEEYVAFGKRMKWENFPESESFGAESRDELIETLIGIRQKLARQEGIEDWENDSEGPLDSLSSAFIQELIWYLNGDRDTWDAESFGAEDMDGRVVNIVGGVGDKVYVTIRFPATNEYYGYDKIFVGEMEDVMLAESFGAEPFGVKCNDPHNKGCGKRDYATRLFNICHDCQEEMRAESFGADWDVSVDKVTHQKQTFHVKDKDYESQAKRKALSLAKKKKGGWKNYPEGAGFATPEYEVWLARRARAESFGAEYGKRQRFGNRYVARDTKGKFISNVSVGRSLKADRRNKSKTPARSGFGHKGDAQKAVSGGFKLPTDAKSLVGIGAVLGGLWAYLESKA